MATYRIGFEKIGIDLKKVNSTGYTTCPNCSEGRKAANQRIKVLKVYKETGYYKCHHCGFNGRVDSDEWLQSQNEKQDEISQPKTIQMQSKPFIKEPLTTQAYEYLKNRGISKATADSAKLAYKNNTICFNYYKNGNIVGAKYRAIAEKKFWQHAGCDKHLYGVDDIVDSEFAVFVEGEFDKLSFLECGIKECVSVSQGAPNVGTEIGGKLQCLDNDIDSIKDLKRVYLACDNDENGQYLTSILIDRFGSDRCFIVKFPAGCKDANDVLVQYGKDELLRCFNEAQGTPIAGVRTLEQSSEKIWSVYDNGFEKGTPTMIRELDGVFSFYRGWWNLWHGIPNSGKSAFLNFAMVCMSVHHGWKWAVFSPEHYPEEDFYIDIIQILTGKKIDFSDPNRITEQEFEVAMTFVNQHFFFVYPELDDIDNTGENVLKKIKELKLSKGIHGFVIDPYNQLVRTDKESIDKYLERSLAQVDTLCKTHNLRGNIVAHPRTLYREKGELDYRKPSPYEIAGGAMWYNKAYCIVNVHRPFNQSNKIDTTVEIDVQKVKSHKRAGTPACKMMHYDRKTGWYKGLDGKSALQGKFNEILNEYGVEQVTEQIGLDFEGDPLPF